VFFYFKELYAKFAFSKDNKCWDLCTAVSKNAAKTHTPVKAPIFLPGHIESWILYGEANPMLQLVVLFAWHASLRPSEVYNLKWTDVTVAHDNSMRIFLDERKTSGNGKTGAFAIDSSVTNWASPVALYQLVAEKRAAYNANASAKGLLPLPDIFFMQLRDGTVVNQRMGIHNITAAAKAVATYNKLAGDWVFYSFRRSSATALAASGATVHQLQQHLGHKHAATAAEYVDSSVSMQHLASRRLAGLPDVPPPLVSASSLQSATTGNLHGAQDSLALVQYKQPEAATPSPGSAPAAPRQLAHAPTVTSQASNDHDVAGAESAEEKFRGFAGFPPGCTFNCQTASFSIFFSDSRDREPPRKVVREE
jgi:hypothetical protein